MSERTVAVLLLTVIICGCSSKPNLATVSQPARDEHLQEKWLSHYTALNNEATVRTYQCISEMYSLAYSPVASGPVCRDACQLWDRIDDMVTNAPEYVENKEQWRGEPASFCKQPKKKAHKERL